jgi:excisionase family DNA binding protein
MVCKFFLHMKKVCGPTPSPFVAHLVLMINAKTKPDQQAFSVKEFCRLYGVGRTFAYEQIAMGKLAAVKAGRRTLITAKDARAWLENLPRL